eukprot:6197897-Pleurochrysis_carterae.AAC.1
MYAAIAIAFNGHPPGQSREPGRNLRLAEMSVRDCEYATSPADVRVAFPIASGPSFRQSSSVVVVTHAEFGRSIRARILQTDSTAPEHRPPSRDSYLCSQLQPGWEEAAAPDGRSYYWNTGKPRRLARSRLAAYCLVRALLT